MAVTDFHASTDLADHRISAGSVSYSGSVTQLSAHDRAGWDRLYGASSEGFDYYSACEAAPPEMFRFMAASAHDGARMIAGAPVFQASFRFDMALTGRMRQATDALYRLIPGQMSLRVLGLGSPHADELALGLAPGLSAAERAAALDTLLSALDAQARQARTYVLFAKDVTDAQAQWADTVFRRRGFARLPTLPVAHLELPFASEAEYVASLSPNMRSNLRRKLKGARGVSVEIRSDLAAGVEHEIRALRKQTQAHAKANYGDFEQLGDNYFAEVMQRMPGRARLLLYRLSGELIGFSLVLLDRSRLTYKYTGMRYPVARDHNVYFLNWMTMVRLCLDSGIRHLHAGETTYLTKVRLGCRLERSWIYFRHRLGPINQLFKLIGPHIAIDRMDPDLRALGAEAPYIAPRGE